MSKSKSGSKSEHSSGPAQQNAKRAIGLVVVLTALVVAAVVSMVIGAQTVSLPKVVDALLDYDPANNTHFVVVDLRLPRTLVALAVGAALGVSGALIQALTRNPLADPGILGVNSGAAFTVALGVTLFGASSLNQYIWFAFIGALIVTVAVYLIGASGSGSVDPIRLVLAGVALGAVLSGLTTALTLLAPDTFDHMRQWQAGTVANRGFDVLLPVLPFLLCGLLIALIVTRPLNSISMGEDFAKALGVQVMRTRVLVVIAVTLLAGSATAVAGPISFVGLMVPHVARWIVGPDQRWIFWYTLLLAPLLMVISDVVARVLLPSGEMPVGVVTAFVGAPVLIVLIRRRKASGL